MYVSFRQRVQESVADKISRNTVLWRVMLWYPQGQEAQWDCWTRDPHSKSLDPINCQQFFVNMTSAESCRSGNIFSDRVSCVSFKLALEASQANENFQICISYGLMFENLAACLLAVAAGTLKCTFWPQFTILIIVTAFADHSCALTIIVSVSLLLDIIASLLLPRESWQPLLMNNHHQQCCNSHLPYAQSNQYLFGKTTVVARMIKVGYKN